MTKQVRIFREDTDIGLQTQEHLPASWVFQTAHFGRVQWYGRVREAIRKFAKNYTDEIVQPDEWSGSILLM